MDIGAGSCDEEAITGPTIGIVMVIGVNVGIKLIRMKGESD